MDSAQPTWQRTPGIHLSLVYLSTNAGVTSVPTSIGVTSMCHTWWGVLGGGGYEVCLVFVLVVV